ncbi:DUF4232 domain-containing protein [Kribbella speibonae]|uniref:DUF4232 domain-containing protein n=1 Tax=Kribbella speibonae TaxID=1572660 RepID=A0ABY2A7C3_9ACTN|nr:DUF4232 domain-containing protein [Kribbella speibonae]TCC24993.1 DUF4232 domain-containing protein [Kribbella speibonae]
MNVHRKHSGSWRRYALGAGAVAALLTTAACGAANASDGSKPSDQQSSTPSASAPASSNPVEPAASTSTATPSAAPTAAPSKKPTDDGSVDLCTMADLTFTVTNYDGPGEDVRHLMLVATNKSTKKCDVQNYPEVTLGNAQGNAPVKEGTADDEAVTLAPGAKAYAGVLATGGHMDTYPVKFMTVSLGSPGGEAPAEKAIRMKMPVTSFEADDGQRVTYWAGTEGLAMRPVTQS